MRGMHALNYPSIPNQTKPPLPPSIHIFRERDKVNANILMRMSTPLF